MLVSKATLTFRNEIFGKKHTKTTLLGKCLKENNISLSVRWFAQCKIRTYSILWLWKAITFCLPVRLVYQRLKRGKYIIWPEIAWSKYLKGECLWQRTDLQPKLRNQKSYLHSFQLFCSCSLLITVCNRLLSFLHSLSMFCQFFLSSLKFLFLFMHNLRNGFVLNVWNLERQFFYKRKTVFSYRMGRVSFALQRKIVFEVKMSFELNFHLCPIKLQSPPS